MAVWFSEDLAIGEVCVLFVCHWKITATAFADLIFWWGHKVEIERKAKQRGTSCQLKSEMQNLLMKSCFCNREFFLIQLQQPFLKHKTPTLIVFCASPRSRGALMHTNPLWHASGCAALIFPRVVSPGKLQFLYQTRSLTGTSQLLYLDYFVCLTIWRALKGTDWRRSNEVMLYQTSAVCSALMSKQILEVWNVFTFYTDLLRSRLLLDSVWGRRTSMEAQHCTAVDKRYFVCYI